MMGSFLFDYSPGVKKPKVKSREEDSSLLSRLLTFGEEAKGYQQMRKGKGIGGVVFFLSPLSMVRALWQKKSRSSYKTWRREKG